MTSPRDRCALRIGQCRSVRETGSLRLERIRLVPSSLALPSRWPNRSGHPEPARHRSRQRAGVPRGRHPAGRRVMAERGQMRALLLDAERHLALVDTPIPAPELPTDVLVRVHAVGICGSDLHGYLGHSGRRVPPLVMGHEATGEVVEVGSRVRTPAAGGARRHQHRRRLRALPSLSGRRALPLRASPHPRHERARRLRRVRGVARGQPARLARRPVLRGRRAGRAPGRCAPRGQHGRASGRATSSSSPAAGRSACSCTCSSASPAPAGSSSATCIPSGSHAAAPSAPTSSSTPAARIPSPSPASHTGGSGVDVSIEAVGAGVDGAPDDRRRAQLGHRRLARQQRRSHRDRHAVRRHAQPHRPRLVRHDGRGVRARAWRCWPAASCRSARSSTATPRSTKAPRCSRSCSRAPRPSSASEAVDGMRRFADKHVVVTGRRTGSAVAIARRFASEGA